MSRPQKRTPGEVGTGQALEAHTSTNGAIVPLPLRIRKCRERVSIDDARKRLAWCDSYSRMETLVELGFEMAVDEWYVVLGEEWSGCDNIGIFRRMLRKMLPTTGAVLPMMDEQERATYTALPERITIYRGCGERNMLGACWSLERDVAAKFPFLNRYRAKQPLLVTATVHKSLVLAVKLDRDEAEVITFGARRATVESLPVVARTKPASKPPGAFKP